MHFCPKSPLQVVKFEKLQDKRGSFFVDKHFEYPHPYVILKSAFCAKSPLQVVRLEKFQDKGG